MAWDFHPTAYGLHGLRVKTQAAGQCWHKPPQPIVCRHTSFFTVDSNLYEDSSQELKKE